MPQHIQRKMGVHQRERETETERQHPPTTQERMSSPDVLGTSSIPQHSDIHTRLTYLHVAFVAACVCVCVCVFATLFSASLSFAFPYQLHFSRSFVCPLPILFSLSKFLMFNSILKDCTVCKYIWKLLSFKTGDSSEMAHTSSREFKYEKI